MSILFENCDLLLRGEDGVYSTLHGFLGVRGDTIDYIGAEKPTGEYEEHKNMEHKLLMPRPHQLPQSLTHGAAARRRQRPAFA